MNPLVAAGIIPANLADIFLSPHDEEIPKKRRVIKARVLTDDEHVQFLRNKEQEEKEAEEAKAKRKQQREENKRKREKEKAEREKERAKKKAAPRKKAAAPRKKAAAPRKKAAPRKNARQKTPTPEVSSESSGGEEEPLPSRKRNAVILTSESSDNVEESHPTKQSRTRNCRMPARFRRGSPETSSGEESDTVCALCDKREPEGCMDGPVFWTDCDSCDRWFHMHCVYGKNKSTQRGKLICEDCLP